MNSRYKVAFVLWPHRLVNRDPDGRLRFVGWVWMQQAYLVNNLNHGWIAVVEDQTAEQMKRCPSCKRLIKEQKPCES